MRRATRQTAPPSAVEEARPLRTIQEAVWRAGRTSRTYVRNSTAVKIISRRKQPTSRNRCEYQLPHQMVTGDIQRRRSSDSPAVHTLPVSHCGILMTSKTIIPNNSMIAQNCG